MEFNYQTTTYMGFGLFLVSEILGLVKQSRGNGIIHSIICLLKGSECVVKNLREVAEKSIEMTEQKERHLETENVV